MAKLKAVYYVNQFFAGIGGEDKADVGLTVHSEKTGPALGIEAFWQGVMEVVQVISCGDNFVNNDENFRQILPQVRSLLERLQPDVFIAGPAFNAGRYGVACAKLCRYVSRELGIPSVTAMYHENPAVPMFVRDVCIVETGETAASMRQALPVLARVALKLAQGEALGPARLEGYLPTGRRRNEFHDKTGAQRVVELLLKKLNDEPFATEVPLRALERIAPAPPVTDLSRAKGALITTGGLVPKGNPDGLKQAFSVTYGRYPIGHLSSIPAEDYESIHGGYDTTAVNADPNRLVPLDELRRLEQEGYIGSIHPEFFTTCGIGTNVESSKAIGQGIAADLRSAAVDYALLTST